MSKEKKGNKTNEMPDILRVQGINSKGYGIFPKLVAQDRRLTLASKGIYAYFCSFAGSGNTAFPSVSKITYDLQINKDTFYRHLNPLKEYGYISVEQAKDEGGKFMRNIYTLLDQIPCLKISDTAEKPFPKKPDTVFPHPVNPDNNNNSFFINNIITNSEGAPAQSCGQVENLCPSEKQPIGGDESNTHTTLQEPIHISSVDSRIEIPNEEIFNLPITALSDEKETITIVIEKPLAEKPYGEFKNVRLTESGYNTLVGRYGQEKTSDYINRIDLHVETTGHRYKNFFAAVIKWIDEDARKQVGLSRSDKPESGQNKTSSQYGKNRFVNFNQRDWDYAAIERMERQHILDSLAKDRVSFT